MEELKRLFDYAKHKYDTGANPLESLMNITIHCLNLLNRSNTESLSHNVSRNFLQKDYWWYTSGNEKSRPYLKSSLISDPQIFQRMWSNLIVRINKNNQTIAIDAGEINKVLYTAIISFAIAFDLWKPGSRKTPGTFYEVLLGSLLGELLPTYVRTKHVPLPGLEDGVSTDDPCQEDGVSTDIVFTRPDMTRGIVIPVKITTRERIVQPFAHQRILDSVFKKDRFNSILLCVSETKVAKRTGQVNDICVPGTIRLFQTHLARISAIYYLDPPERYLQTDLTKIISVGYIGQLLANDLPKLI